MSSEQRSLIAMVRRARLPPCLAHAFSITAGGILAPFRKPGMETFFDTSASVLSYDALVAAAGICRVSSTADSGRRLRELLGFDSVEERKSGRPTRNAVVPTAAACFCDGTD